MSFKFNPCKCPECGGIPVSTREQLCGDAVLSELPDGTFEYEGTTHVDWDSQYTIYDPSDHKATLLCDEGHEWQALMLEPGA